MKLNALLHLAKLVGTTGLSKSALQYLYDKATGILSEEKADRAAFQASVEALSDEELKVYIPDVYQEDIYRIDYERLKARGIKLISFDIDDTIDDSFINKFEANAPLLQVSMPDKARELVRGLKSMGFTVVLLTNAQPELAEGACKDLGADDCISRAKKPETRSFEMLAERYGLDRSEMAHVGNSIRADIAGGNKAGVTTCLVRRAGVSLKLVIFVSKALGLQTKGHLIRAKLLERDFWRKHHVSRHGDQYYQLGEEPAYRKLPSGADAPAITVFYDGKAPYAAAFNLYRHIQSLGYEVKLRDAEEHYNGYPGKAILIGHHDLTKKQLAVVGVLSDHYGMLFGAAEDLFVLRAKRSALGKGRKGRKKFAEYYDTRILAHKELAQRYDVPMQFGTRDKTRKSQYDLMWLEFAAHWLDTFLTGVPKTETGGDIARLAAEDLIQKVNADLDRVFTLDELFQNAYEENQSAGVKTLRKHLGENFVLIGLLEDAQDGRELEQNELLPGEVCGYICTLGSYTIRSATCLYQDHDTVHYTQMIPAVQNAAGQDLPNKVEGARAVHQISVRYNGSGPADWTPVCVAATSISWMEEVLFIAALRPSASAPAELEQLFVLKQYIGSSFSVDHWYKVSSNGTVTEYSEHPFDPESFETDWNDPA